MRHKSQYFDVPDLETKSQKHDNPHHWLQQDILQVKNFQYRFFHNITLTEETIPQVKVFTNFLLKFFRFNYQLLWEQQDQQAYINFPQILTSTEQLPYIIKNEHKHLQYRDPTSFSITYFEQIIIDHNFISEHFETSDNRPYCITNNSPETISEEQSALKVPQFTRQNTIQSDPILFTFLTVRHLNNQTHFLNEYFTLLIYNKLIPLTVLQYIIHQNFLTKTNNLKNKLNKPYKIHKVLLQLQIQILYISQLIIIQQTTLLINTKIPLPTQLMIIPLFYLHLKLTLHNHLRHKDLFNKIMIHLLFHLKLLTPTILIILLNKVLLILKTQIQSTFKHQLHLHLLKYTLQLILPLKITQYKTYKQV